MISLKHYLNQRIAQSQERIRSIKYYAANPNKALSKKEFDVIIIPAIEKEIEESQIALKAIDKFKSLDDFKNFLVSANKL